MPRRQVDPVDQPEACQPIINDLTEAQRDRARLKTAEMAADAADLVDLLEHLGLADRSQIAAQLGRRREATA